MRGRRPAACAAARASARSSRAARARANRSASASRPRAPATARRRRRAARPRRAGRSATRPGDRVRRAPYRQSCRPRAQAGTRGRPGRACRRAARAASGRRSGKRSSAGRRAGKRNRFEWSWVGKNRRGWTHTGAGRPRRPAVAASSHQTGVGPGAAMQNSRKFSASGGRPARDGRNARHAKPHSTALPPASHPKNREWKGTSNTYVIIRCDDRVPFDSVRHATTAASPDRSPLSDSRFEGSSTCSSSARPPCGTSRSPVPPRSCSPRAVVTTTSRPIPPSRFPRRSRWSAIAARARCAPNTRSRRIARRSRTART